MGIKITDFRFKFVAYGMYEVTYTSPITNKMWTRKTTNMPLIDATKSSDSPKVMDLNRLKNVCKRVGIHN